MARQRRSKTNRRTGSNARAGSRGASPDKPGQLRIVGGQFRARRLAYSGDRRVRPMKDRTREAVFNLIGPGIRDTHVWDLFAGTGAMSLESISRGARSATMIERHMGTAKTIRQNIEGLDVSCRAEVIQSNAFFWGRAFDDVGCIPSIPAVGSDGGDVESDPSNRSSALKHAWTVFCCPPYAFYEEQFDELKSLLCKLRHVAPPDSLFVIEAEIPFDFQRFWAADWKTRNYAPAAIGIDRG